MAGVFFCLGAMCYWSAAAGLAGQVTGSGGIGTLAAKCLESLQALIDGMEWGRRGTAGLLRALLSGDLGGLDPAVRAAFRAAGASHILALSGLHLGIIYAIISKSLGILGHSPAASRLRSAIVISLCGFYSLMTGFGPSITRAFLFITLNEILRHYPGRSRNPLNILCTALTIQLVFNPLIIKSIGFQLSYLAMAGIVVIFPRLEKWFDDIDYKLSGNRPGKSVTVFKDPARAIWSAAALSISCQLTTAPLVWLRFGTFPKYFLLTNLIAMPLTSVLMMCSVITLTLSALDICPDALIHLTDLLASALTSALEIISSM